MLKIVIEFYLLQNTRQPAAFACLQRVSESGIWYDVHCVNDVCVCTWCGKRDEMWKFTENLKYEKKRIFMLIPSTRHSSSSSSLSCFAKICLISLLAMREFFVMLNNFFSHFYTLLIADTTTEWNDDYGFWSGVIEFLSHSLTLSLTLFRLERLQKNRLRACLLLSRIHQVDTRNYCHIVYFMLWPSLLSHSFFFLPREGCGMRAREYY